MSPGIVDPADYLPARLNLLEKEKELTRARDALNKERQALPVTQVTTSYTFTALDSNGKTITKSLQELFDSRPQLIIYHFMFDPAWTAGCPSCTLHCETLSRLIPHLNSRGTTLVAVSRAPAEKIAEYKTRMGFTFPWFSSHETSFNEDFRVTLPPDRDDTEYNFTPKAKLIEKGMPWFANGEQPGLSTFILGDKENGIGEDGVVYHAYSTYARGPEPMNPLFAYLDVTKLGRRDDLTKGKATGTGFRRRDEYSEDELKGIWV